MLKDISRKILTLGWPSRQQTVRPLPSILPWKIEGSGPGLKSLLKGLPLEKWGVIFQETDPLSRVLVAAALLWKGARG